MRNRELNSELQRLRSLIDRTSGATTEISLIGEWGRYLCVMTAGFLERGIQMIYQDFADRSASPRVAHFVSRNLNYVQNPNAEKFLQTAGNFDNEWRQELEEYFANNARPKEAINSIISLRNSIAHGGEAHVSPTQVRDYLDQTVRVLEFIEDQCHS